MLDSLAFEWPTPAREELGSHPTIFRMLAPTKFCLRVLIQFLYYELPTLRQGLNRKSINFLITVSVNNVFISCVFEDIEGGRGSHD